MLNDFPLLDKVFIGGKLAIIGVTLYYAYLGIECRFASYGVNEQRMSFLSGTFGWHLPPWKKARYEYTYVQARDGERYDNFDQDFESDDEF